ncbi:kinesin-like protein KIF28, partial [Mercenaria mercenaria]|uniref:kinesin-like protein KIF28 n=1 Tax=Mercenaria mercenaria TaxID=6596 RepID=UPI00234EA487
MESGGVIVQNAAGMSPEEIEKMRKQMEEEIRAQLVANQQMIADEETAENWDTKLAEARREAQELDAGGKGNAARRQREIHLVNLNEDPMLSGVIVHFLKEGQTRIGRKDAQQLPDICLSGLSILKQHAVLTCNNGMVQLEPVAGSGTKTKVNGVVVTGMTKLTHKDRLLFGSNHLYVFMNPKNTETTEELPAEITWEFAQKEIAQVKGFATATGAGLSK